MKNIVRLILCAIFMMMSSNIQMFADNFTVKTSGGNWTNTNTWYQNGNTAKRMPNETDDVTIASGKTVYINDKTCVARNVVNNGILQFMTNVNGNVLSISSTFVNNGDMYFSGNDLKLYVGGDLTNNKNIDLGVGRDRNVIEIHGDLDIVGNGTIKTGRSTSSVQLYGDLMVSTNASFINDENSVGVVWFRKNGIQNVRSRLANNVDGIDCKQAFVRVVKVDEGTTVNVGSESEPTVFDVQFQRWDDGIIENAGTINVSHVLYLGAGVTNTGTINVASTLYLMMQGGRTSSNDGEINVGNWDNLHIAGSGQQFTNNGTINVSGLCSIWRKMIGNGEFDVKGDLHVDYDMLGGDLKFLMTGSKEQHIIIDHNLNTDGWGGPNWEGLATGVLSIPQLTIKNTSVEGVVIDRGSIKVKDGLSMLNGPLHTAEGGYVLCTKTVPSSAIIGKKGSWVHGDFRKEFANPDECLFPIGSQIEQGYATFKPDLNYTNGKFLYYTTSTGVQTNFKYMMPDGVLTDSPYYTYKNGKYGASNSNKDRNNKNTENAAVYEKIYTSATWQVSYYDKKSTYTKGLEAIPYAVVGDDYWIVHKVDGPYGKGGSVGFQNDSFEFCGNEGLFQSIYRYYGTASWVEEPDAPGVGDYSYSKSSLYTEGVIVDYSRVYSLNEDFIFAFGVKNKHIPKVETLCTNQYLWMGYNSTNNWNTANNWTSLSKPTSTNDVYVRSRYYIGTISETCGAEEKQFDVWGAVAPERYPIVFESDANCHNLIIGTTDDRSPAKVIVNANKFNVSGDLYVNAGVGSSNSVFENNATTIINGNIQNNSVVENTSTMQVASGMLNNGMVVNDGEIIFNGEVTISNEASFVSEKSNSVSIFAGKGDLCLLNNGLFNVSGTTILQGNVSNNGVLFNSQILRLESDVRQTLLSNGEVKCVDFTLNNVSSSIDDGVHLTGDDNGVIIVENAMTLTSGVLHIAGENKYILLLGNNVNFTNCGSTCYIDGFMFRKMSTKNSENPQYLFPLGNNGRYSYAMLSPNRSNNIFGARYYNEYPTPQVDDLTLYRSLDNEYWSVKAFSTNGSESVYVKFHYDSNSGMYYYNDDYVIAEYNGSKWKALDASSNLKISRENQEIWYTSGLVPTVNGHKFSFGHSNPTMTWTGLTDDNWFESSNWMGNKVPLSDDNVIVFTNVYDRYPHISNNGVVNVKSIAVNGADATLTINGGSLVVADALNVSDNSNPGHVIINQRYDQTSNLKYGSTNYDKFTVNRTFPAKVLYYVGSAVKGGGITSGFNSANGDYIANYIPSSESYQPQSSFLVDDCYGYNVGLMPTVGEPTERTITQVGDLKMDDTQFSLTLSNNKRDWEPDYGWDLISNPNPFAYPINKDAFYYNCDPVIWFRRFGGGQYYYSTISLESNVDVSPSSKTHPLRNEKFIAPNQAFFVKSTAAGQYFKFKSSYMTKDKMVTDAKLKSVDVERDVLRLTVESNNKDLADEMAFVFRDGGSMVSIRGDAEKRMEGSGYNQIYSLKDGGCYAIPFYPEASIMSEEVLPLGVQLASGATEGVIRVRNMADFDKNVNVSLYDYKNNKIVDLREVGEYAFVAESGVKINDRFAIVLTALENEGVKGVETGVMDVLSGSIMISQDVDMSAVVTVSQDVLSKNAEVNVYDMAGRLVKKQAISQVKTIVNLGDYKGVYVVEAVGEDVTKRAKLRVF